jgi:hypothetical protein
MKMLFDLVVKATLNERYGLGAKHLQPFRDYAELDGRGEDPRAIRAQALSGTLRPVRAKPTPTQEPAGSAGHPSMADVSTALAD